MKTIWKFPLSLAGAQNVLIPEGAVVLCVQMQAGQPTLWALVDPAAPMQRRVFEIFGTGHAVPQAIRSYIGTVQDGAYVWHFFDNL